MLWRERNLQWRERNLQWRERNTAATIAIAATFLWEWWGAATAQCRHSSPSFPGLIRSRPISWHYRSIACRALPIRPNSSDPPLPRRRPRTCNPGTTLQDHYLLLTTHYSLPTTHCSLLTTHYLLLTTYCSLLTTYQVMYSLSAVLFFIAGLLALLSACKDNSAR